ncbi:Kelch repeat protein [Talaromyces stipitatus ATCC 10500]|uniref:Kelch repeat protein n=1 Tax=Talaromyces stipitatus (strain ATCC 10500 / CBS 375.48 / QM 6759 / NRRL 1006) TaxID=441959 RepID=B8M969_TALSN|nr:Kelch repeat protein [Talaromyces stipitatus ATCC 10500]EED17364.1 Kelch repeat protein [Talaromyces stipitatus ATCC 10500]
MTLHAKWHKLLDVEILRRSSQALSAVDNKTYVFGGELRPREPRDNALHVVSLGGQAAVNSIHSSSDAPSPRVGTATTALKESIYLFSGRGGVAMAPIDEQGAIWKFDTATGQWSMLSPVDASNCPEPRSYHCMTCDQKDTIYIHAGCPEKGRLSDLWSFSVSTKQWKQLASAPDPARGGTSIAFADGKLYRMNGFDGKTEQGGSIDVYTPETNSWESHSYEPDSKSGPIARSVCALLPVAVGDKSYVVTLFGESDPSNLGHQGAGKMLGDVWAFDIERKTWHKVDAQGDVIPDARGWFGADVVGKDTIVVQGGLGEANNRLGDVWRLDFV